MENVKKLNFWGAVFLSFFTAAPPSFGLPSWIFQNTIGGSHSGAVRVLVEDGNRLVSAGDDGFIETWNLETGAAGERFQASPYPITAAALRPGASQLCLVESDGLGLYRISAWELNEKRKLFTLRFRDPVSFVNYSAAGSFIIAARSGRTGLVFIHPETGEILPSPAGLSGMIGFAATGKSERIAALYFSAGTLSYRNLETGAEIESAELIPNLSSPLLFENNRLFAGIDSTGLAVLDAVSGELLIRGPLIPRSSILRVSPDGRELVCAADGILYRFRVNNQRRLENRGQYSIPAGTEVFSAAALRDGSVALGTGDGTVKHMDSRGALKTLRVKNQIRIVDAAVSGSSLAFIGEDGSLCFLPLDFFELEAVPALALERGNVYDRIEGFPGKNNGAGTFLLWQSHNARAAPLVKNRAGLAVPKEPDLMLDRLPLRYPIRSAALWNGKALFLNSAGDISVLSAETGALEFSYSSLGSLDAAFLDRDNIIIGRSALGGNTPFLKINIKTGETVPLPFSASAGVRLYRGAGGTLYAAGVDEAGGSVRTTIVKLNPADPSQSARMVEYQGEDTLFALAECEGIMASTLGGEGASLYTSRGMQDFERGPGLPVRLIDGAPYFITLDGDGSICWHDPHTGELLALFRLYQNDWMLQQKRGAAVLGKLNR
jgi:outer membrane protein assembly factor BamB